MTPPYTLRALVACLLLFLTAVTPAQSARKVQVYVVSPQAMQVRSSLQGDVLPLARMELVPRVTGYVKTLHVREGARVQAGAALVTMDCPDLVQDQRVAKAAVTQATSLLAVSDSAIRAAERAVDVAKADLASTGAELAAAKATARLANLNYQRFRTLHAKNAATAEELESAEMRDQHARAALQGATSAGHAAQARVSAAQTQVALRTSEKARSEAGVVVAEASLARATLFVDLAAMKNPYSVALVTRQIVDAGNLAIADETAILELMDISKVRVRFMVPRMEASRVRVGSAVNLFLPRSVVAVPTAVTHVAGALDPASRTMACEVELDNTDGRWVPGSLVKVDVLVESLTAALLMPSRGVVKSGDRAFVWTDQGGVARRIEVRLGLREGRMVQVVEGLEAGAGIIVAGFTGLADGDKLEATAVKR